MSTKKNFAYSFALLSGLAIFSTYAGSGFATGRQLVQFYVRFGWIGVITNCIPWVLCVLTFFFATEYCRRNNYVNYKEYAANLYIPKYGKFFVLLWDICMVITFFVMIASILSTFGELLVTLTGLEALYWVGVLGMAALILLVACFGSKVMVRFNSSCTIIMFVIIFVIAIAGIAKNHEQIGYVLSNRVETEGPGFGWWPAILAALSVFGQNGNGVASYAPLAANFKNGKKDILVMCITGFLLILVLNLSFIVMLLGVYPEVINVSLANLFVVQSIGSPILEAAYYLLLCLAMVTTGGGALFGFAERMGDYGKDRVKSAPLRKMFWVGLILVGAICIAQFGLIRIVAVGQTYVGYMGIVIMLIPTIILCPWRLSKMGKEKAIPEKGE